MWGFGEMRHSKRNRTMRRSTVDWARLGCQSPLPRKSSYRRGSGHSRVPILPSLSSFAGGGGGGGRGNLLEFGGMRRAGKGRGWTQFWLDWWTRDGPLAVTFPILFSYVADQACSIAPLAASNWDFAFRRVLSPEELATWQDLIALLPTLSETPDKIIWPHPTSG